MGEVPLYGFQDTIGRCFGEQGTFRVLMGANVLNLEAYGPLSLSLSLSLAFSLFLSFVLTLSLSLSLARSLSENPKPATLTTQPWR